MYIQPYVTNYYNKYGVVKIRKIDAGAFVTGFREKTYYK